MAGDKGREPKANSKLHDKVRDLCTAARQLQTLAGGPGGDILRLVSEVEELVNDGA
jgi:hypothetical protein